MKNFMLALVVLFSAISIAWAINQPEKPVAPEEESSSSEVVLQTYSESEYLPHESSFTDFSSLDGVSVVNIVGDRLVLRAIGTLTSTSFTGVKDYVISACGACQIPKTNGGPWTLYYIDGLQVPPGCWDCQVNQAPQMVDLDDYIVFAL